MNDLFAPAPIAPDIHVGIGGWVYAPWRGGMFYPTGLVQRRELEFASRQLTSIEINGTYYGTQKPSVYAGWRDATPEGFVFSAKAPKRIVTARKLASTGGQINDFIDGISHLGDRLGPLVWQFESGRTLDRDDVAAFLALLPTQVNGRRQRHALEIRDPAFLDAQTVALARQHNVALVYTDSPDHPNAADLSSDFVYARLMRSRDEHITGYPQAELTQWKQRAQAWRNGNDPQDLPHVSPIAAADTPREVFLYFISAAKHRNPAAARELLQLWQQT
ncbi:MAG: DUF72 domain-containing protein [Stenotrophomonas sp.]|uniref:DUF72 domain-containing protein n=1 Tax=Stenotrophomonas sp. TaxID=69392 RepID=UPI003D6D409F